MISPIFFIAIFFGVVQGDSTLGMEDMSSDLKEDLSHPCSRNCSEDPRPRLCRYHFKAELYTSLSKACYECPSPASDCSRPHCVALDGYKKPVITVNRRLPGPSIQVCEGDEILVDLKNELGSDTTSIHWHGLHMTDTPYMDGVPHVTQCPVVPASTFRYHFLADNVGTHYWHSHSGFQRADGMFGSLLIRSAQDGLRHLYDTDDPSHVLLLTDWLDALTIEKFVYHHHSEHDNKPYAILVNGRGYSASTPVHPPISALTVTQGQRHRLRLLSNSIQNCPVEVSVDGHRLLAIAKDGASIEPVPADSLVIYGGERWDVVVAANQTRGNYWIKFHGLLDCDSRFRSAHQVAVLHYEGADDTLPTPIEEVSWNSTHRGGFQINSLNAAPGVEGEFITAAELRSPSSGVSVVLSSSETSYHRKTDAGNMKNPDVDPTTSHPPSDVASVDVQERPKRTANTSGTSAEIIDSSDSSVVNYIESDSERRTLPEYESTPEDHSSVNGSHYNYGDYSGTPDHTFWFDFDFHPIDNEMFHHKDYYPFYGVPSKHRLFMPQMNYISFAFPAHPPLSQPEDMAKDDYCHASSDALNALQSPTSPPTASRTARNAPNPPPAFTQHRLLLDRLETRTNAQNSSDDVFSTGKDCMEEFCHCVHTLKVKKDSLVEVVLIDKGHTYYANHPFHLHGHVFAVLGMERLGHNTSREEVLALEAAGKLRRNFDRPPLMDTVTVPDGGYTVLRFRASNPGFWLFHCHITFHIEVGMGLLFEVGDHSMVPPAPPGFPKCGSYTPTPYQSIKDAIKQWKEGHSTQSSSTEHQATTDKTSVTTTKEVSSEAEFQKSTTESGNLGQRSLLPAYFTFLLPLFLICREKYFSPYG